MVIAEKLHAMVVLDIRNSRMKDFYDIWFLARTKGFDLAPVVRNKSPRSRINNSDGDPLTC